MPSTSYDHLLKLLERAESDLIEAQRVAVELVRDRCLADECRELGVTISRVGFMSSLVKYRI